MGRTSSLLLFLLVSVLAVVCGAGLVGCDYYITRPNESEDAGADARADADANATADARVDAASDAIPDATSDVILDATPPAIDALAPPDAESATDASPTAYRVNVIVTGLSGSGLILQNNAGDNLPVLADGTITFAQTLTAGAEFAVTVLTQPATPAQLCTVSGGAGRVASADVAVTVSCTTSTFSVGGTVIGLLGSGLILQNNLGDSVTVAQNGASTFNAKVASGASFSVSVLSQPGSPSQTCAVSGGAGSVGSGNVTSVVVNCDANTYTIGGTISGLASTVVVQDNGGSDLSLTSDGSFVFLTPLPSGSAYTVTVKTQPGSPAQTCSAFANSGTVGNANVSGVVVLCVTRSVTIGGTISGLTGGSLVLRDNGGDDLPIATNGVFSFVTPLAAGTTYSVTTAAQPNGVNGVCMVSGGSGVMPASTLTSITVTCARYATTCKALLAAIPGTVSGTYTLDPDGDNPIMPLAAQCDMGFDGGGWTLIHSAGGQGVDTMTPGVVTTNSATYMPLAIMQSMASLSQQVHIRTPANEANASITSVAGSVPIQNLRLGIYLGFGIAAGDFGSQVAQWTGPYADSGHLGFTCGQNANLPFPVLYWSCGTDGMHILGNATRWNWSGGNTGLNEPLDTYIR